VVQTQHGVGSTFEMTLPLDTGEVPSQPRSATSEVSGRAFDNAPAQDEQRGGVERSVTDRPVSSRGRSAD
jgi:hypothetical protein